MAEFGEDFLTKNIGNQRADIANEIKGNLEPNQEFYRGFDSAIARYIKQVARRIPPEPPTKTIQVEGRSGVLPSPAKRVIAKEALAGQPLSPLRIANEEVPSGDPERTVDEISLHLVTHIDVNSFADKEERDAVLNSILSAWKLTGRPDLRIKPTDEPLIRIKNAKRILHMLKEGAVGNFKMSDSSFDSATDVRKLVEQYQHEAGTILDFQSDLPIVDSLITHELFRKKTAESIKKDDDRRKISIPIIISPRRYSTTAETFSDRGSYRTRDWDTKQVLPLNTPFIMVYNGSVPFLGVWDGWQVNAVS